LSVKLAPTFTGTEFHVVSMADPYGRIPIGFIKPLLTLVVGLCCVGFIKYFGVTGSVRKQRLALSIGSI
jgi:hypothetical protein